MKKIRFILAFALALILISSSAFTGSVSAAEKDKAAEDSALTFTKIKTTVSLTGHKGLFELFETPVDDWYVNIKITCTVKNSTDKDITFEGGLSTDNKGVYDVGKTHVTVASGKKAKLTFTGTARLGDVIQGDRPTEKQTLSLLNGNSVKIPTKSLVATLEATCRYTRGDVTGYAIDSLGDFAITFQSGEADIMYIGEDAGYLF